MWLAIDSILDSMLIWAKDTTSKDRSMDIQNRATSASASYEDSALAYILLLSYELLNHCEYMTLEGMSLFLRHSKTPASLVYCHF